jgi:uncharacterized membrane protein YhaH (DUF805 family)
MNWMWLFLSFTGRINRAKFWTAIAIQLAIAFAFGVLAYVLASYPGDHVSWVLLVILLFPIMISVLAVMTKRLHDRDKSGWWTLLFYFLPNALDRISDRTVGTVSLVFLLAALTITVWAFVELGVLRGTTGLNRFGADPLA